MGFDKAKAVRAAEKYIAQGKIPAAVQEYRRIVEYDAADVSSLNTLGDLYARIEKRDEAVACYKRVAAHYREQGFGLKAIAIYKKITRFHPGDTEVASALGELYERQGLLVEARAQYLAVADALARQGQSREALDLLRRVADLDPNNIDLRLRLAQSFLREEMHDMAAAAFIEAGERLSALGDYERALDAYTKALTWRPSDHTALHGLVAAHSALGTADEAADVLEQTVAKHPGDIELRLMLARALIEAENAPAAEVAVQELVEREAANYTLFFDVARLFLNQGVADEAVRLLARVAEPAMAGREEERLLELLQEALARDPEQVEALKLLVRIHTWQRDDDRLRVVLESLAETAESLGLAADELAALSQLVRLSPEETRFRERLEALGGSLEEEAFEEEMSFDTGEVPTFESFMFADEPFASAQGETNAGPPAAETHPSPASEFEWNSVEQTPPAAQDASASFADLNEFTDSAGVNFNFSQPQTSGQTQSSTGLHDVDFSFSQTGSAGVSGSNAGQDDDARRLSMLEQELEGVDFYLSQGYTDIALDTLDVLERQFGSHPSIETRRSRLLSQPSSPADSQSYFTSAASGFDADAAAYTNAEATAREAETFDFADVTFDAQAEDQLAAPREEPASRVEPTFFIETPGEAPPAASLEAPSAPAAPATPPTPETGIDPGLAAIFDEFREAVEDADASENGDFETHYNMGLAYKEMELMDQAIEEFQLAVGMSAPGDGTARYLQCCNLLGHCFMSKGVPRAAAIWFKKGLDAPGHTEDEYQALRYELGTAYEQMGELERAINTFTEVYGIDVSYRGVADKLRELQAQRATK